MPKPLEPESEVLTETKGHQKLKKPRLYKVLLHNDDYTTMEFVVMILRDVFHRSEVDAVRVMLDVHLNGIGVAGVYGHDVAETKVKTVESLAHDSGYPLKLTLEPEDD